MNASYFYPRPCGRGDQRRDSRNHNSVHFYSRPCGRGDIKNRNIGYDMSISTHAPAGGATARKDTAPYVPFLFLLTPLREGRHGTEDHQILMKLFLLTPLREGRPKVQSALLGLAISTHAPAGGATSTVAFSVRPVPFLLTPLREGRPTPCAAG